MNFESITGATALLIVAVSGITFATHLRTTLKQRLEHAALTRQVGALERLDRVVERDRNFRRVTEERADQTIQTTAEQPLSESVAEPPSLVKMDEYTIRILLKRAREARSQQEEAEQLERVAQPR
ncbi:MAG TPA: hypothetical protein VIL85_18445 [Thermomicrobiales bacterium]|jgi:dTDP-D-glucose 4,6-dehydratase